MGYQIIMIEILIQFLKFGFVGGLNTLISLGIYYFLIYSNFNYMNANVAGYIISSIAGYIINKVWVFKVEGRNIVRSAIKYYCTYALSLLINIVSMYLWVNIFNFSKYLSPLLTICLTVPFNFLLSKYWVFKVKIEA